MLAWKAYQATDAFKNSLHWAMTIAPMLQAGDPDAERKRYGIMPIEQREQHVMGSLWAAFCAGRDSMSPPDLRSLLKRFRDYYPMGINPDLDQVYRDAGDAV